MLDKSVCKQCYLDFIRQVHATSHPGLVDGFMDQLDEWKEEANQVFEDWWTKRGMVPYCRHVDMLTDIFVADELKISEENIDQLFWTCAGNHRSLGVTADPPADCQYYLEQVVAHV